MNSLDNIFCSVLLILVRSTNVNINRKLTNKWKRHRSTLRVNYQVKTKYKSKRIIMLRRNNCNLIKETVPLRPYKTTAVKQWQFEIKYDSNFLDASSFNINVSKGYSMQWLVILQKWLCLKCHIQPNFGHSSYEC